MKFSLIALVAASTNAIRVNVNEVSVAHNMTLADENEVNYRLEHGSGSLRIWHNGVNHTTNLTGDTGANMTGIPNNYTTNTTI